MSESTPRDWAAIFAEIKAGVLSKGEVCRRYNVPREALDRKLAANGIVHGSLLSRVEEAVRSSSAQVALLSDDDIVSAASQRSSAVIKSHLTLTRSLQARLALLVEGYDDMVHEAMTIDPEGNKTLDAKKWTQAAAMLYHLTKSAERLTQMELRTFGVSQLLEARGASSTPVQALEHVGDDAMTAAETYQRVIRGEL